MKPVQIMMLTAVVLACTLARAAEPLRIATQGAYPPFNHITADGSIVGFDIDIARALCAEMKRSCTIIAKSWDDLVPGLVDGEYDAIIASMPITNAYEEAIVFTAPYYSNYLILIAREGMTIHTDQLDSYRLGAQRATISGQWLQDNYGHSFNVRLYDTQIVAYADLAAGRLDVMVSDLVPGLDWISKTAGFAQTGEAIDIGDKAGIAVRFGEDELRSSFGKAIEAIRRNGVYIDISRRYFGRDIY